ncbi:MAG: beta-lactamase family protein [Bacteroidales bacterium]|nr:beta-lactamase family protein [Bacteroidales bacterium]
MNKTLTIIGLVILGLMVANCNGQKGMEHDTLKAQLDSLFEARYPDANEPGAAVLIAKGDSIIYERYFGIADMDTHEPIDSNTLFNIASVSKQFTVIGLMQTGIDLERKASEFFDFPQPFWKQITLADLAGHTSGIPDSRDRSDREKCIYATDESSEAYFPTVDSLKFEPGTAYDYLNPSFILLARVIKQSSGVEFTKYQQEHIFRPLGMTHTIYFSPDSMPEHTAHGYIPDSNGWKEYDYGEETFFATRPDGGIYSTARDMLKWEIGLDHGVILPDSLIQKAYNPRINVSNSPWCDYQRRPNTWYGMGWFVDTTPGEPVKVYHTGDNGGFQAYVAKYPSTGIKIIVLENRNDRDRWSMARAIDSILN